MKELFENLPRQIKKDESLKYAIKKLERKVDKNYFTKDEFFNILKTTCRSKDQMDRPKKVKSNEEALKLKNQGMKLSGEKSFKEAINKFDEALENICTENFTEKSSLFWWKADTFKKMEEFDEAIIFYELAIENVSKEKQDQLQNQIVDCLKDHGISLNKQKKYHDAVDKYNEALSKCSNSYKNKYSLFWWKADALKANENFDEASQSYELALKIVPSEKQKDLHNQLVTCYKAHGMKLKNEKKYSNALEKFETALKKCSDDYAERYVLLW